MPICKIKQQYENKNGWSVGDMVDISNPTQLIREGKVVMLNGKGEEIAPEWVSLKCPICMFNGKDPIDLAQHILDNHSGKTSEPKQEPTKSTGEEIKKKRLEALEKARAARKLKQLEKNVKKREAERDAALKEAVEATKAT